MMQTEPETADTVRGDACGIAIPAHPQALERAGAAWLTEAFRAYGAIAPDNAVTAITRCAPCLAGNSGEKLLLSVAYARPQPGLHTDLFVKFSRHFGDAFRDRRRHELAGEVRLAGLSRLPAFPIPVAKPYFADFDRETGTGLLITQQIAFGEGGIEPLRPKNLDHELANPLAYYSATITALARLAAAHQSGRLSPQADEAFPFDADAAMAELAIPYDRAALLGKVEAIGGFVASHPWLLTDAASPADFIARFERDALRLLDRQAAVQRFLYADPRFIALTHWNTHIDNAWFWRDGTGVLQCGLLDWGMVRQMNFAIGLWGGLSGAMPRFLERHLADLLALFVGELRANGGPPIETGELRLRFDLSVAMIGLALLADAPALVRARLPEIAEATSLTDPILRTNQVGNGFLHTFAAFLAVWAQADFAASLERIK
jgi:hypothetical protein